MDKRKRLWAGMGIAAVVGGIGFLVAAGLKSNVVFFLTPSELHARAGDVIDAPLRLGGQVKPGSKTWDPETLELRFIISDSLAEIPVESLGAPPSMFREGIGVVVEGRYRDSGVFESTNLMVKHSNEYEPPHGDRQPQEMYRSLVRPEGE
ncbi:MAG: cytochrome c maturation protein CcmE [Gemmatimonadota bacterium]